MVLLVLLACSKGESKPAPGSDPGPGGNSPGTPGKAEKTVKGTLTFGGTVTGSFTWKSDMDISCACINEHEWQVGAVFAGDNNTTLSLTVHPTNGIELNLNEPVSRKSPGGAGISGSCKPDNVNADGVIAVDLDAKVAGKDGDVTIKGHLDVVCRAGL
jgi:hypothetical protein